MVYSVSASPTMVPRSSDSYPSQSLSVAKTSYSSPAPVISSDHYRTTAPVPQEEGGLKKVWNKVKGFLKTPEGKLVVGGALAAGLIFTPILPMTVSAIGGGLSGLGGALASAGGAISGAAGGLTAGLGGAQTAIASTLAKPFVGALAGGAIGSYVAHKWMDRNRESKEEKPVSHPPMEEVPTPSPFPSPPTDGNPISTPPTLQPIHPPVMEEPLPQQPVVGKPLDAVDPQARKYILALTDRLDNLSNYVKSQHAGKPPSEAIRPTFIKIPVESFNKLLDKIGNAPLKEALPTTPEKTENRFHNFANAKDNVKEIKGIGDGYGRRLSKAGIHTIGDLLEKTATASNRRKLARETGISSGMLLTWANHADLMRIDGPGTGIGPAFARLLETSGVDTIAELAQRNASELHKTLKAVNDEHDLVQRIPGVETLEKWIQQAAKMDAILTY